MMNRIVPSSSPLPGHDHTVPTEMPTPVSKPKLNGIDLTDVSFNHNKQIDNEARACPSSQFIHRFISAPIYKISSVLAVFLALFLTDITRCALSPDTDTEVDVIMLIVFFFLLTDVVLQSIAYPKYIFSMFFWLDFIGTITLLADMDLALSLVGQSYSELTVARGGRAGRAARSAGSLRLSRIMMWARIGRIVRVARVMRVARLIADENTQKLRREEHQLMRRFNNGSNGSNGSNASNDSDDNDAAETEDAPDRRISIVSLMTESSYGPNGSLIDSPIVSESRSSCANAQKALDDEDGRGSDSVAESVTDSKRSMRNHQDRTQRARHLSVDNGVDYDRRKSSIQETVEQHHEVYRKTHSSKIGITVADSITRDVVFGILLTVALTPIFNSALEETYSAMWSSLEWLDHCAQSGSTDAIASMGEYVDVFLASRTDVLSIAVDGVYFVHDESVMNGLRDTEIKWFEGENTEIMLDISANTRFGHGMNIGFTLVIVFLFASLAFIITRTVSKLVVRPIERMTQVIQEFTKRIVFLGGDVEDQTKIVENLMETTVIEMAFATLTNIFNAIANVSAAPPLQPDRDDSLSHRHLSASPQSSMDPSPDRFRSRKSFMSALSPALPQAEATTSIKTRDSVIKFHITQKKNVFISEEEIQRKLQQIGDSTDITSFCVTVERFPEFKSVSSCMSHPVASLWLENYCSAVQAAENFSFIVAVNDFHEKTRRNFLDLWDEYLKDGASNQITVQASHKRKLWEKYETNEFSVNAFDDFKKDILESMHSSIFVPFKNSRWAMAYVGEYADHINVQKRFSHLNLGHFEQPRPPSPNIASAANMPRTPERITAILEEE